MADKERLKNSIFKRKTTQEFYVEEVENVNTTNRKESKLHVNDIVIQQKPAVSENKTIKFITEIEEKNEDLESEAAKFLTETSKPIVIESKSILK